MEFSNVSTIPDEIWIAIFDYLPVPDYSRVNRTNKHFHKFNFPPVIYDGNVEYQRALKFDDAVLLMMKYKDDLREITDSKDDNHVIRVIIGSSGSPDNDSQDCSPFKYVEVMTWDIDKYDNNLLYAIHMNMILKNLRILNIMNTHVSDSLSIFRISRSMLARLDHIKQWKTSNMEYDLSYDLNNEILTFEGKKFPADITCVFVRSSVTNLAVYSTDYDIDIGTKITFSNVNLRQNSIIIGNFDNANQIEKISYWRYFTDCNKMFVTYDYIESKFYDAMGIIYDKNGIMTRIIEFETDSNTDGESNVMDVIIEIINPGKEIYIGSNKRSVDNDDKLIFDESININGEGKLYRDDGKVFDVIYNYGCPIAHGSLETPEYTFTGTLDSVLNDVIRGFIKYKIKKFIIRCDTDLSSVSGVCGLSHVVTFNGKFESHERY